MQLYNTLSAEERAALIEEAGKARLTLSFYAYAHLTDPQQFRDELFMAWQPLDVLGRIYVAKEGINAQLSIPAEHFDVFRDTLEVYDFMRGIRLNVAVEQDDFSFLKLTIKVRDKIVADGLNDDTFDVTDKGIHLKATDFNEMLQRPDTVVVDMRNHYESEIGYFNGAVRPDVDTFRESLPIIEQQLAAHKEDKNLLMYCTGGIRCEKASAYFRHKGFKNVYQLEGGIIEYARQVKAEGLESQFIGKNFVFDQRLGERITDDVVAHCHQCGKPSDTHTNCANEACHLLFIQCEDCAASMEGCCSQACVDVIRLPQEQQKALRRGIEKGNMVFKKGKSDVLAFKNPVAEMQSSPTHPDGTSMKSARANQKKIIRKTLAGKGEHYYPKAGIGAFRLQNDVKVGEKLMVKGPTTGEQIFTVEEMFVSDTLANSAKSGELMTVKVPFRVRLSDRLYKIQD